MTVEVVAVTDARGAVVEPDLLSKAESVHRQLRPHLAANYSGRMKEVFGSGAEMAVALVDGEVAGVTVFRVIEKTFSGRELYCDDLVTDEHRRSKGVGRALIQYMEKVGRERKCDTLALDSGTQRQQAHKFYFREQLPITASSSAKNSLTPATGSRPGPDAQPGEAAPGSPSCRSWESGRRAASAATSSAR